MNKELETGDIQGIIRRGYGKLDEARFVMLKIIDVEKTKEWLGKKAGEVRDSKEKPGIDDKCLNLAFTYQGLIELGMTDSVFVGDNRFSTEFEDGMTEEFRSKILGDIETSAPENWRWGGPKGTGNSQDTLHILVLLYAGIETNLHQFYTDEKTEWEANGLKEAVVLGTQKLPDRKEHFGFRDGIGQPIIAGLNDDEALKKCKDDEARKKYEQDSNSVLENGGSKENIIAAGEFILGYHNIYSQYTHSPKVENSDAAAHLPKDDNGLKDFGKNGSYLVFRQLEQHVQKFWKYIDDKTKDPSDQSDPEARDMLAAKMVGRWRSGCPLTLSPDKDDPTKFNEDNFNYYPDDKDGDKCPMSSHVRRSNPRNSPLQRIDFNDEEAEIAYKDANKHRIIRRGRAYGKPGAASMAPEEMLNKPSDENVGLHFLCFNSNLSRQFEFIQHTWINNPKFAELYNEADPLLGAIPMSEKDKQKKMAKIIGDFAFPDQNVRQRFQELNRFVDVVGGSYFFMPGIKAIQYLADLPIS